MRLFLLLLCLSPYYGFSQENETPSAEPKVQFFATYFHNGTINPGLQLGASWVFNEKIKINTQDQKKAVGPLSRQRIRQFALETRLGFYWDPLSHFSFFNQYLFSFRWVFENPKAQKKFWTLAAGIGPGYQRNVFEETYQVDDNNQVIELGAAGRGFVTSTIDFHFIRARKSKKLNAWIFGFNNTFLYDYNATVALTNNLYFGFRFNFKPQS